ncbi:MAG: hypothetical protein F7B18_07040 [Desulfurococcales archaeon]|nr:hypothetical protein [Desulfurococcales archaeon]
MEGVRVDECLEIDALRRGLRRITRTLGEAVDRIPPHHSPRSLVESSLGLALGLSTMAEDLYRRLCSSGED